MFTRMRLWIRSLWKKPADKPGRENGSSHGSTDRHKPLGRKKGHRRHRHGDGGHDWSAGVYM